jgi:hypothetical protein
MTLSRFLDYEVLRENRGTPFARQFEATHPNYPGTILVEALANAPKEGPRLEAFEREVVTFSLLENPYVLEAVDLAALADGTPAVVSALPAGVSLASWLDERRPLDTDAALDLLAGVAQALLAAHQRGLAHGCVCTENVFLASDEWGGPGTPRVHGFRQRRLCTRNSAGGDSRRADVRALAALAEQLLTPAELRTAGVGRSFGAPCAVMDVTERAMVEGGDGFASPVALVEALAAATMAEEPAARGGSRVLVRFDTQRSMLPRARLADRPRGGKRPLLVGLAAGSAVSLLALLALEVPVSRSRLPDPAATTQAVELAPPAPGAPVAAPPRTTATPVALPAPSAPPEPRPRAAPASLATIASPRQTSGAVALSVAPRRSPSTALRRVVWSNRAQRLVPVDERGMVLPGATDESTPNAAVAPPPLTVNAP